VLGVPLTVPAVSSAQPGLSDANIVYGMDPVNQANGISNNCGSINNNNGSASNTNGPAKSKEIIHCKSCTLFPPNPSGPPPTTREKPPGCKTVFVGGLPENATEEMIRDIFEPCGEIRTVRLSKKNFCHIRYDLEEFVENAISLSG